MYFLNLNMKQFLLANSIANSSLLFGNSIAFGMQKPSSEDSYTD